LALVLLRFTYAEGESFIFGAWRGYLTSERMVYWIVLVTIARLVIFLRPSRGLIPNFVAVVVVTVMSLLSFGDAFDTTAARLGATLAFTLGAVAFHRRRGPHARSLAQMLTNAALLAAYRATVSIDARSLLELEVLLAALRATALVGLRLGRLEDRSAWMAWLEALALLVATWSGLALTLHRLEWHLLYVFFKPAFVERHVILFLPFIIGRYALPLVVARRLLAETRPPGADRTWQASFGALGLKLGSAVSIVAGYAIFDPTNEPFSMAVQNVLSLSPLALALLAP